MPCFVARLFGLVVLLLGVVPHCFARLLAKLAGDGHLRGDLLARLVSQDGPEARLCISGSRVAENR